VKPNNVLEVVISHNTGISEGWVGQFDGPKIQLVLDQGYSAPSAKVVTAGVRLYGLVEGQLFSATTWLPMDTNFRRTSGLH